MAYDLASLLTELVKGQEMTEDEKNQWYAAIARNFDPPPVVVAPVDAVAAAQAKNAELLAQLEAQNAALEAAVNPPTPTP